MIMWLAKKLGWRTTYHVSWKLPISGGETIGDATYVVKPWLSGNNFGSLRQFIADEANTTKDRISITSVTRL